MQKIRRAGLVATMLLFGSVTQAVDADQSPADGPSKAAFDLTINVAIFAEQIVSPREAPFPRRSVAGVASTQDDHAGDIAATLRRLDQAGVDAFWLYGFRASEGTMRDIGLLKATKEKLERLGKAAYVVCEPLGHPAPEPPSGSPRRATPAAEGWRYRINADGKTDWGCACLDETVQRDVVAATRAFRDAGFTKVFFDDDLRMAVGHGRVRWGDTVGGCFCDRCIKEFSREQGRNFSRTELREVVLAATADATIREAWVAYNCRKITDFMKAVDLPGLQVGIMVMADGGRNHGVDLAAIQRAVPDCLVRVGEGRFNDEAFDDPAGKTALIASLKTHKALVADVSRLYSENTVEPWPRLRPDSMAAKLLIEVEYGLRNIMLMPPQLLDAPEYWAAIAAALPRAQAILDGQAGEAGAAPPAAR